MEDRVESAEAAIKKLQVHTNYEAHKFFRFMNDSIKKNDKAINAQTEKLNKMNEFYEMMDEYPTLTLIKCFEHKIFPAFEAKTDVRINNSIKIALEKYTQNKTFNEFKENMEL